MVVSSKIYIYSQVNYYLNSFTTSISVEKCKVFVEFLRQYDQVL